MPSIKPKLRLSVIKNQAELAYFGDVKTQAQLSAQAASSDRLQQTDTKLAQQLAAWWNACDKPTQQSAVLDQMQQLANANAADDNVAAAIQITIHSSPATVQLAQRAGKMIEGMRCPFAVKYRAMPVRIGYPVAIFGQTLTGQLFSLAPWKNKVVLVDFWATWCPGCVQEVPEVTKLYQQYHRQGLEIVGVSSDQTRAALQGFLAQHPNMAWPQLFVGGRQWHPLARRFQLQQIPTMFLLDRNGVVREITDSPAKVKLMIPKLLNEGTGGGTT